MPYIEDSINLYYDNRIGTLSRIKSRSLGADGLVLSALTVLTYAQLEGGVKDLCAFAIKHINFRKLRLGDIAPTLLAWRAQDEMSRLQSMVNFEMITTDTPFSSALERRVRLKAINRRAEFNQMTWGALKRIYGGFGFDSTSIAWTADKVGDLVDARNEVAHHGAMPGIATTLLEGQLRDNVSVVDSILTDFTLQLLGFFSSRLYRRSPGVTSAPSQQPAEKSPEPVQINDTDPMESEAGI